MLFELINYDVKINLVDKIKNMDFTKFSNKDLLFLQEWSNRVKAYADVKTLEEEIVGYTYDNVDAINRKLVKSINFKKSNIF